MPEETRLSYDELVAVLRSSTALQRRTDEREFSRGELLEAARELGVSEAVVSRALETHLARRSSMSAVPKPFDTRVALEAAPERFVLEVPPRGLTTKVAFKVTFAIAWFSFIGFFTKNTLGGSIAMTLFTIPFWFVGGVMVFEVLRHFVQRTRLELGTDDGSVDIKPFGRKRKLRTKEIVARLGEIQRGSTDEDGRKSPAEPALVLEHGVQTFHLLEGYSDQERRWVEAELKAWLARNNLDDAPVA